EGGGDGGGEWGVVRARGREPARQLEHVAGIDRALERAAEGGPDRDGCADAVRVRPADDLLGRLNGLLDGRVRVALVERLGGGEGVVHLVEARGDQTAAALLVHGNPR